MRCRWCIFPHQVYRVSVYYTAVIAEVSLFHCWPTVNCRFVTDPEKHTLCSSGRISTQSLPHSHHIPQDGEAHAHVFHLPLKQMPSFRMLFPRGEETLMCPCIPRQDTDTGNTAEDKDELLERRTFRWFNDLFLSYLTAVQYKYVQALNFWRVPCFTATHLY